MAENTLEAPSVSQEVAALRTSPVGYLARDMAAGSVAGERGVALRELPFLTQIGLRVVPGSATARVMESALGLSLPQRVGEVGGDQDRAVLWQGPDEFLLVGPPDSVDAAPLAELLGDGEGALPGSVVDLSGNRTTLELSGPSARSVLEKGCHFDMHPSVFATGSAVTTTIGPVPVILWKTQEDTFRIMPRASFADYMVHWLLDAMLEFSAAEVA
ncbi:MAG: sarcosine oxidase subunit gamma family protein [Micrococcaceae bacterium]|uniref:sarcosine oxidase subunit gamma n=1 Tax=Arthrobacter sp. 179 TaxID=3457734 RepID=UPI002656A257|nr:sarcosine oxidase subunit gamma family protein [Micrococcaceae bacterium]MDN5813623.1 sarcosine oxidase subunit gamma family protein [Micrococcaceae bacterium]MDN5824629.1 sarcosine oxidase subunit gamma family protein [Micrococcaceae bacterium]MDN5879379.1 sarcosine oxidase subunit gamma family protein [Micrococcaceae bacterium]MDN5887889.1 sarcosine oxidase subunit gamma family protein [Micrococcaceae bacterium]